MSDYKKLMAEALEASKRIARGEPVVMPFIENIDDDAEQTEEQTEPVKPTVKPSQSKPTHIKIEKSDDAEYEQTEQHAYKHASPSLLPIFPRQELLDDPIFRDTADAVKGRTEAPIEYHYAVLKALIGATLGRRIYIDGFKRVYPNFYVAIIGPSGEARKTSALEHGVDLLKQSGSTVKFISSINSTEGLYNYFGIPSGCELGDDLPTYACSYEGMPRDGIARFISDPHILSDIMAETETDEGFRITAYIDELSSLLLKAKNPATANIIQTIQSLYNMPSEVERNTKSDPLIAPFPCFSLIGGSTIDQFHGGIASKDILGGLANRLEYYVADQFGDVYRHRSADVRLMGRVSGELNRLRRAFAHQTEFDFTDDADAYLESIYAPQRALNRKENNAFVKVAIQRWDNQLWKNALIFAALRVAREVNVDAGETADKTVCLIEKQDLERAYALQKYLIGTARFLYGNYADSELGQIENSVLGAIDNNRHTPKAICNYIKKPAETVLRVLNALVQAGILGDPVTTRKATKYYRA